MYVKRIVISALQYICDNQLKKSYLNFSGNDYPEGEQLLIYIILKGS